MSQNQQTNIVTLLKGALILASVKKPSFCSVKEIRNDGFTKQIIMQCFLVLLGPVIKGNASYTIRAELSMVQTHQ